MCTCKPHITNVLHGAHRLAQQEGAVRDIITKTCIASPVSADLVFASCLAEQGHALKDTGSMHLCPVSTCRLMCAGPGIPAGTANACSQQHSPEQLLSSSNC